MLNIAQDVCPEKSEAEIIKQVGMQFERTIKMAVIAQKIATKNDLFNLLEDFDNNDYLHNKKKSYTNNNNNNNQSKNNDNEKSDNNSKKKFGSRVFHSSPNNNKNSKNSQNKENNSQKRNNSEKQSKNQHLEAIAIVKDTNNQENK